MENLSLSVPDLLTTAKQFVEPQKHEQLDQMLQRYMQKELGKQQASSPCCSGRAPPACRAPPSHLPHPLAPEKPPHPSRAGMH